MDWKKQFEVHDLSFRDFCIVLLLIAVNLFILVMISSGPNPDAVLTAHCAICANNQKTIYRLMSEAPEGEGFELPPEWTVADLIREAAGKDFQTNQPRQGESVAEMGRRLENMYLCRNVFYSRAIFHIRRKRSEVVQPYLVFPVPASVALDESLQPPVPLLMCPPGAHGKLGSNVLYSDGSVRRMTTEEAESLVAEKSPVPMNIALDTAPDRD